MPYALETLAAPYAGMQRHAAQAADSAALKKHILSTLQRCLPPAAVTQEMADGCYMAVHALPPDKDPMHTGAIHAYAGSMLLLTDSAVPLLHRLHAAACRLLPPDRPAGRDDLRRVSLAALYDPKRLRDSEAAAFVRHRLGLRDGVPRSCEEIAAMMHTSLVHIHELEAAVLSALAASNGGPYA